MIASTLATASNHHRGRYTSPALAAASYPFVDLLNGNTLRCKLFPSSKFYNRPLYFSETMRYNEVNDKLEFVWEVEYSWENSFCLCSILFLHLF